MKEKRKEKKNLAPKNEAFSTICSETIVLTSDEKCQTDFLRKPLRAAIFIQFAGTTGQEISIENQLKDCEEFIQNQGWVSSDIFQAKEKNNIYRLMKTRAKSGAFDIIVSSASIRFESPRSHIRDLKLIAVWDAKYLVDHQFSAIEE